MTVLTDHWQVLTIEQTVTPAGYEIVITTDHYCNLILRWTNTVPQKHILPVIRRGAPVGTIIDQCFVAYHDVPQEEEGDTLVHTFIVEPWPHCEWRWFYFFGTVDGHDSPSLSPIYEKHRHHTFPTPIFIEHYDWLDVVHPDPFHFLEQYHWFDFIFIERYHWDHLPPIPFHRIFIEEYDW